MLRIPALLFLSLALTFTPAWSQDEDDTPKTALDTTSLAGLKFRSLGPAITSGRISDFAMHPDNPKIYYVATSSGGVWKTVNAGTTFTPIFDGQGSYSTGCVTLDPNNPEVVWVGTGENNNQRSVAYGDGIYKSSDGGKSWEHKGLKESEHIGKIIVHPDSSDVVYVAAIGPLWSAGGDRGVYKTRDGGTTWDTILYVDEHTGVNDIVMDPRDPDVLYASAFQRRRHVFTYISGGPGSGMYKTTNGGENWTKINKGLPSVDLGRIGLAIAPSHPEVIYAIVDAAQGEGGFYRTTNRGGSWEKRGGYSTSGNYYQEIVVDPNNPDIIYGMDVWMQISTDGGKSFSNVGEKFKHVDNHCLWINPDDSEHLLAGCDGGIYETWDRGATWDFKANLPVVQFYKVSVDNAEPFYNIYGGTQDNNSLAGPSRSVSGNGIANEQWILTRGGDGFETQVDPEDPNIIYAQSQYGVLFRYDRKSGEELGIQPQPRKGENAYRWNWDAPLVISKHDNKRLYFAANKVFRTYDRGNSWEVISDDLTREIDRNTLPVMGRVWGIDAVAKNGSTSPYGTIVAFDESPLDENLLFAGTDDGLIQITEDGGESWTEFGSFSEVPERTYVNMVLASQHDADVVYACFNNHKNGDFAPYVYKSTNMGRSWTSITGNLPERGSTYSIAEDHVDPDLLFVGTEFGVFFTPDGGEEWKQLKAGVPTIAVRDIAIQPREDDLVLGTFGRGFFVLDDYSPLREIDDDTFAQEAELFAVRDPWTYEISYPLALPGKSFQGDSYYQGENLMPSALFTYYLKDDIKTLEEIRREREKEAKADGEDNPYLDYDALKAEVEEAAPQLLFTVENEAGELVRQLWVKPSKGINRVSWDLRFAPVDAIDLSPPSFYVPWAGKEEGVLVPPGSYQVSLSKWEHGEETPLAGPQAFEVKALDNTTLPAEDRQEVTAYQREMLALSRSVEGAQRTLSEVNNQLRHIREAIRRTEGDQAALMAEADAMEEKLREIRLGLQGDPVASRLDIDKPPSVGSRLGFLSYAGFYSTAEPSQAHRESLAIAREEFQPLLQDLRQLVSGDLKQLQDKLVEMGAPYTPYSLPDFTGQ